MLLLIALLAHSGVRAQSKAVKECKGNFMAKKISGYIKLQIPAGKANPSPPIGPALGQKGVNIMEFCKAFNKQTENAEPGILLPTIITVYVDKSFSFESKTPPASVLLKKMAGLEKGSAEPNKNKVATVTMTQIQDIATTKSPDLSAASIEAACKTIIGTARSMGIEVKGASDDV